MGHFLFIIQITSRKRDMWAENVTPFKTIITFSLSVHPLIDRSIPCPGQCGWHCREHGEEMCLWHNGFISSECTPRREMAGWYGSSSLKFLRITILFPIIEILIYIPTKSIAELMVKAGDHYVEWNKLGIWRQTLYNITHVWNLKTFKL